MNPGDAVLVPSSRQYSQVLAVLALAATLRLIGLGANGLWYDEALEVARDRIPWPRILLLHEGPDPPLYRVLQSPIAARTTTEAWLRLPSACYSVATIWIVWRWIVLLGDPSLGLLTALLLAISPLQVYYAQEVSQYALSGLMGAWVLLASQKVTDRGLTRDWLALSAALILAICTYYGLVFLIAGVDIVLLLHMVRERKTRAWWFFIGINLGLLAAAFLLYALMFAQQQEKFTAGLYPWLGKYTLEQSLGYVATKLEEDLLRYFWLPWSKGLSRALFLLPLSLLIVGAIGVWRRGWRWRAPVLIFTLVLAWMCLADGLGLYPFVFRYAFFLSPLFFLFIAGGLLASMRAPMLGIPLAVLVVVAQLVFLPNLGLIPSPWLSPPYENLERALNWVEMRSRKGDSIYLYYGAAPAFRIYRSQTQLPVVQGMAFRHLPPEQKVASIETSMRGRQRFFLVMSHIWESERETLVAGLNSRGYRLVDSVDAVGAFAGLLEERRSDVGAGDD